MRRAGGCGGVSNNIKTTRVQREEILRLFVSGDEALADAKARALNLAPNYAWKLARARGLVPRTYRNWGKLREIA